MKKFFIITFLLINCPLYSGEKEIISLAFDYINNGEQYNCITETLRYRSLFPEGNYSAISLNLTGKAYYAGGNFSMASRYYKECFSKYPGTDEAEESLINSGWIELIHGSPFMSNKLFQKYNYIYDEGNLLKNRIFYRLMRQRFLMT